MRSLFLLLPLALTIVACQEQRTSNPDDVVQENYVHKYGVDVPQQDWDQRGQSGKVITTLKNGVVVEKNYEDGLLEGQATYTFPNSSQIETYETYQQGALVRSLSNYPSGAPKEQSVFGQRGARQLTVWYEGGTPQRVEDYKRDILVNGHYFNPQNQQESTVENGDGIRTSRDPWGQLVSSDTIQNSQMVSRTSYHPNGLPSAVTPYDHEGVVEGTLRTFNPDGSPATVEQWSSGKRKGFTAEFKNGEKVSEVTYVDGSKSGTEKQYRDGSEVIQEIEWVDGKKHGPCRTIVGPKAKTEWYYQDRLVSKKEFDILSHDKGL